MMDKCPQSCQRNFLESMLHMHRHENTHNSTVNSYFFIFFCMYKCHDQILSAEHHVLEIMALSQQNDYSFSLQLAKGVSFCSFLCISTDSNSCSISWSLRKWGPLCLE